MIFDPLDFVLGRRSNVRLLRALAPLDRPVSGREATRLAGLSHRTIAALDDLVELGIVTRREGSGQHWYQFDRDHVLAPALFALFEAERERVSAIFSSLKEVLDCTGAVRAAVIFGSSARGEAEPGSDLDLLVLTDAEADVRVYEAVIAAAPEIERRLGVRLSPVVLSVEKARRQYEDGDPFIAEVLRDGRRVTGEPLERVLNG